MEVGALLIRELGPKGSVVVDEGAIHVYDPERGLWNALTARAVRLRVQGLAGWPVAGAEGSKPLHMSANKIKGVVGCAMDRGASDGWFGQRAPGIVLGSLSWVVEGSHLIGVPHAPGRGLRMGYEHERQKGAEAPPMFAAALRQWFEDRATEDPEEAEAETLGRIAFLQEFIGACLLGLAPSYGRVLMLTGGGENGKSTLLKLLSKVFQGRLTSFSPQALAAEKREYALAKLPGSMLNVASDIGDSIIADTGDFKALVTGDPVTGRNPAGEPFTFVCRAGHLFSCNTKPPTRDQTEGFFRRWSILPMSNPLPKAGKVEDYEGVLAAELPQIVAWALDGVDRLLAQHGYTLPPSHGASIEQWKREANPVAAWVASCGSDKTVSGGDAWSSPIELLRAFREWATDHGFHSINSTTLGRRLSELGVAKRHTAEGARWNLRVK